MIHPALPFSYKRGSYNKQTGKGALFTCCYKTIHSEANYFKRKSNNIENTFKNPFSFLK